MLPMDPSDWIPLPLSLPMAADRTPPRPQGVATLLGETPIPSPSPHGSGRRVVTCYCLAYLWVAPKGPDKMNNESYVAWGG